MKKIITISREFGAGGGEIGQKVAERLGFRYFDKELILQAANQANISPEKFIKFDEQAPKLFGFTQSLFDLYSAPLDERMFEAQRLIIREIGERENCVIVGRNANSILKEFDNSLHVFIHADPYWRLQRLKKEKMPDATEQEISGHIRSVDKARRKYCTYYTDTEFGVAQYYDICLCSSTLGVENCIDLIVQLAKS